MPVKDDESASYSQIAKSTGIFAGSQLINIVAGIVRTKVLAVLLGTIGIGLAGMYQSVVDFVKSIAGLGLSFSSVKDISEAASSDDQQRIASTVTVTRRLVWLTGIAGMLIMILFSKPLSQYLFGNSEYVWPICLLSFCVLTGILSSGQMALLQGTRQLLKMAKASVSGTVCGLIIAIVFYAWLGIEGIVPALIGISLISLFFSWFFSNKTFLLKVNIGFRETIKKGGAMLKLGFFTMLSGLASTITLMLMKSFILKAGNMEMVGLYQAVWSVSFMYLGAILSSMATDYYPRLCGLNGDDVAMVRFSNEQTRFVLLVTTPIVFAVLLLASPVLQLLYSSRFTDAVSLMEWQLLGTYLKVLIWPVGFFLLAKGKGFRFLLVEVTWYIVYYAATRVLWAHVGIESAGIAYLIAYLVYCPLVFALVRPLCKLSFTRANIRLMFYFTSLAGMAFLVAYYLEGWLQWSFSAGLFLTVSLIAVLNLDKIFPIRQWPEAIRKLLKR